MTRLRRARTWLGDFLVWTVLRRLLRGDAFWIPPWSLIDYDTLVLMVLYRKRARDMRNRHMRERSALLLEYCAELDAAGVRRATVKSAARTARRALN